MPCSVPSGVRSPRTGCLNLEGERASVNLIGVHALLRDYIVPRAIVGGLGQFLTSFLDESGPDEIGRLAIDLSLKIRNSVGGNVRRD